MPEYKLKSYEVNCDYCNKIINLQTDDDCIVMDKLNKYYCGMACFEEARDGRSSPAGCFDYDNIKRHKNWLREYHKIWLEILGNA